LRIYHIPAFHCEWQAKPRILKAQAEKRSALGNRPSRSCWSAGLQPALWRARPRRGGESARRVGRRAAAHRKGRADVAEGGLIFPGHELAKLLECASPLALWISCGNVRAEDEESLNQRRTGSSKAAEDCRTPRRWRAIGSCSGSSAAPEFHEGPFLQPTIGPANNCGPQLGLAIYWTSRKTPTTLTTEFYG